jgi:hypothetical protein
MWRNQHGIALGLVIIIAMMVSIAAFGVLMMGVTNARTGGLSQDRLAARYAAEGGVVWAMQKLYANPNFCGTQGVPVGALTATVTVSSCGAGNTQKIQSKVSY